MANYTATSSMTLEAAIAAGGMTNGEDLTITSSAVVTCTQTPSVLIGAVNVLDGKLLIDGTSISSGNVINFVGEYQQSIYVQGYGVFEVTGDWYSLGTTDGTDNQSVSVSTYFGGSFVDVIPAIWVETGRRINFTGASGTTPEVDDWVYLGTKDPAGRIVEVQSTYLVVKFLIGSVADSDPISVRKVVDNNGPDFQEVWTATANGADVKEAGVYQEFGNCMHAGTDYMTSFGDGMGGFIFAHAFQGTSLTLGGSTGGFVPPSGCDIRIPNVHFSTSNTTDYASGNTKATDTSGDKYNLSTSGGEFYFSVCNIGTAWFTTTSPSVFEAEYVGACKNIGASNIASVGLYLNCVVCSDPVNTETTLPQALYVVDCSFGVSCNECLVVSGAAEGKYLGGSTTTVINIKNSIVSLGGGVLRSSLNANYYFLICSAVTLDNCVGYGHDNSTYFDFSVHFLNCNTAEVTRSKLSPTPKGVDASTNNAEAFNFANTSDVMVSGLEVIGSGRFNSQIIYTDDSTNIKVRAIGMLTEKVELTKSQFAGVFGVSSLIDFARVWRDTTSPTQEEFWYPENTASNVLVQNCSTNYASEFSTVFADNVQARGLHCASGSFEDENYGVESDLYSVYGSHMHDIFRSDTTGAIVLLFTPKTPTTVDAYTITAGVMDFDRSGHARMYSGAVVEYEMQYYALGHTGFTGDVTFALPWGSVADGTDRWGSGNLTAEFQYDLGAGYNGTWLSLRTAGNLTGISGTEAGVKLKIRLTALNYIENLSGMMIHTTTTLAAQAANLYPIDQQTVTVKVIVKSASDSSLIEGARVYLKADAGGPLAEGTVIFNTLTNSSGYVQNTEFSYSSTQPASGWVRKGTSSPAYKSAPISGDITSSGFTTTVFMVSDE